VSEPLIPSAERVLIVEDDEATRTGLAELIASWGYRTAVAVDGRDGLEQVSRVQPSVIVSDLVMPRMTGLDLLKALAPDDRAQMTFVLLTAQGTIDTAVEALKAGAEDYLTKPVDPLRLRHLLDRVTRAQAQHRENLVLRRQLADRGRFGRLVGASAAMRAIYRVIELAAPTPASILICGESGTGKELVAQTLHQLSPRASGPFVGLNCAAIPETLLESEIFGHERGAFTGATERRAGCFELADHGTLFLDEIAEMAPATQVKLLRVLQERRFRRLGGRAEQEVDVRVLAATNVSPETALREGRLRDDLYYRLNVFTITLPPLRDRRDDVPLLVQTFLDEFSARDHRPLRRVTPEALALLQAYDWPGNVRELRNVMERASILSPDHDIAAAHLALMPPRSPRPDASSTADALRLIPGMTVDEAEMRLIHTTLEAVQGNKTRAAEMLGISLKTLHNKLNRDK
jgi:DNA-binding NtrC family response regulator